MAHMHPVQNGHLRDPIKPILIPGLPIFGGAIRVAKIFAARVQPGSKYIVNHRTKDSLRYSYAGRSVQFDDLCQKIELAIKSLSPAVQRVFILNRFEGKRYHEIALELEVSQKTVEAHMTRAQKVLRDIIKDC